MEIIGLFDAYYVVEYISVCEELRDLLYVALLWSFEKDEIYTTIILLLAKASIKYMWASK